MGCSGRCNRRPRRCSTKRRSKSLRDSRAVGRRSAALDPSSVSRRKAMSSSRHGLSSERVQPGLTRQPGNQVTNLDQTKNPLVVIFSSWRNVPRRVAARVTVRDLGPSCGQPATRGTHDSGGEVMAHGNLGDRPSGGGPTRRRGLGLLALALIEGRLGEESPRTIVRSTSGRGPVRKCRVAWPIECCSLKDGHE
jgi:hypothetical protein